MCTVAFVPLEGGGYLLGHNRDERPVRARGEPPRQMANAACRALAPRDPEAGGTWIAVNEAGITVCVLNAADRSPDRVPALPRSRGLAVQYLVCAASVEETRRHLASAQDVLARTRAFHMVAVEPGWRAGGTARVGRFRWDGMDASWETGVAPAIFVSSLLYPIEVERERTARWRARLGQGSLDREALAAFLSAHEPERGPLSVCMHRDDAGTVSRTLVEVTRQAAVMRYRPGPPCTPWGPDVEGQIGTGTNRNS
jgi:hypothetical protein